MKILSTRRSKKLFLLFLFTSLLYTTINVTTNSQVSALTSNGTVIAVEPANNTANPDECFTVNFTIANVTDLYGWSLKLGWQPGELLDSDTSNITEGPFLKGGGSTAFVKGVAGDYIDVGCVLMGIPGTFLGPVPQNGSGLLASTTFKVTDVGNSTLELYDTLLIGWNWTSATTYEISHTTVNATFYTTYPKAAFTYTPHPLEHPGRPIVGETVTFNATASYDPDQFYKGQPGTGIVSYEWDFGDGTNSSGVTTTHVYDENDTYYVTLTVTDDDGETYSETYPSEGLIIQFHDIAVINVTVTPTEVSPGGTVSINATVLNKGSATEYMNVTAYCNLHPVNTTAFTYWWWNGKNWVQKLSLLKGENATTTITWHVGEIQPGDYAISVEVFIVNQATKEALPGIEKEENLYDNGMVGGFLTITEEEKHDVAITNIVVEPTDLELGWFSDIRLTVQNKGTKNEQINATVTARAQDSTFNVSMLLEGGNLTLNAGETKTLEWLQWLRATDTMKEGLYDITASVIIVNATALQEIIPDNETQNNNASKTVNMRIFPEAMFTYSPKSSGLPWHPIVDETVTFNASWSYAPGATQGTIKYSWNFGDGVTKKDQNSPVVQHVYTSNGTFTVTLNVTEGGLTSSTTKDVTISPFHNLAITNIVLSPNVITSGKSLSINVTIQNMGYFKETFNVTTYYYEGRLPCKLHEECMHDTQTNIILMANAEITLTFTWNTANVAAGNYTISALITPLATEIDTTDNTRIGGVVTITKLGSEITLTASLTTLTIGESTTLTGFINPTRSQTNVTVWISKNGEEWIEHETVLTGENGSFMYIWEPPSVGFYGVQVRWLGDNVTHGNWSAVQIINVQEPPPSELNVFLYTTIAFALLNVVILAYFLWARKTKRT